MKKIFLLFLLMSIFHGNSQGNSLPEDFVYVQEVIPDVILEMRYAGTNNFIGRPVPGYNAPVAILSRPAANALKKVQEELKEKGYCLKIFDAYRPQRAVDYFVHWARDEADTLMKQKFYPNAAKKNLFQLGYISSRSGHTRGSTIDLTIVDLTTGLDVDMGGKYDFFGELSHHTNLKISAAQQQNRVLLKHTMMKHGFQPYHKEWWHYTFQPEPYPNTYFDIVVE